MFDSSSTVRNENASENFIKKLWKAHMYHNNIETWKKYQMRIFFELFFLKEKYVTCANFFRYSCLFDLDKVNTYRIQTCQWNSVF